jgi:DNA-binding transcriptional MerR regulator
MREEENATYPVRTITRLTGLTPDVLRVWERRYGAVTPMRTPGGTRRYTRAELDRLQRLKGATDAGHRIGSIARLDSESLEGLGRRKVSRRKDPVAEILQALQRRDEAYIEHLVKCRLAELGTLRFVRQVAVPLLEEIDRERSSVAEQGDICESSLSRLRLLMGAVLRIEVMDPEAPIVLFASTSQERDDLGMLVSAMTALGAGARPVLLESTLPQRAIVDSARTTGATAVGLRLKELEPAIPAARISQLRDALPDTVELWVSGLPHEVEINSEGVRRFDSLLDLERHITQLRLRDDLAQRRMAR